jgi:catechol 2,3-dioxygenase-like lactoylglutathione lyase family enzyme
MIDHVSVPVSDLARSAAFYGQTLGTIGYAVLVRREGTVGFGKRYPEFWINLRPAGAAPSDGYHVALRCRGPEAVEAFHAAALAAGGADDGAPGLRPEYAETYYAAFIRDPDGHRVEAVTFLEQPA